MINTGYKAYTNLAQYFTDNEVETGITKSNSALDPDYIAPFLDLEFCPLPSLSPSPTPTPTVTPSITPTITPTSTPSVTITPSITVTPSVTPSVTITPTRTPSVTVTPSPTPSSGLPVVLNYSAGVISCVSGQCNNTLIYSIYLNKPARVPVNYVLTVQVRQFINDPGYGGDNEFISTDANSSYIEELNVFGIIKAGDQQDNYNLNACGTGGGEFIGCSSEVISVCIKYVDSTVTNNAGTCNTPPIE
jgi:hypothetical protein